MNKGPLRWPFSRPWLNKHYHTNTTTHFHAPITPFIILLLLSTNSSSSFSPLFSYLCSSRHSFFITSCTVKLKVSLIFFCRTKEMNHFAVQPNAFAAGGDLRSSVSVVERDQTTVVCPKPRRIGLRTNPTLYEHHHHPSRSLRCYFSYESAFKFTQILNLMINLPQFVIVIVICFSHQLELCESKAETDILDIILTKDSYGSEQVHTQVLDSPSPFLCGSPPSRVANPLTQDARFRDDMISVSIPTPLGLPPSSLSSSGRKGGCVRGNFGNSPAVRVEGFDCLDRDSRNWSIHALA